jgi:uracil-DNA glycosylase
MISDFPILPSDWLQYLQKETDKPYYRQLRDRIIQESKNSAVFPPAEKIFSAFELCPFEKIKVVIIGQDPYHGLGQAHGLCFSVSEGLKIPPSLKNIYKEMQSDLPDFKTPPSGNLQKWASQGIFLLNAVLTVREGAAGSHRALGWEAFTDAVITTISDNRQAAVFLLWGNYAIKKRHLIDEKKHLVLTAAHPSPLAGGAFFGCRHFSKTNEWLIANGIEPVDWSLTS